VQVVEPFRRTLADKYPFAPGSTIEASSAEISQLFGPEGQIAKFVTTSMGPLVHRRGDAIEPRTWSNMGMVLAGPAAEAFPCWIAPIAGSDAPTSSGAQQVFQLQATPAPGILEYTIDIDGQVLRYRNTPPTWTSMVHPGPSNTPGARIVATTFDGRTVEVFNSPGQSGLKRMMSAATRSKKEGGMFELKWGSGDVAVTVDFRFVSSAAVNGRGEASQQGCRLRGLSLPNTIVGAPRVAPATELAMARQGGVQ
jgi:type VI secretion system protein ImpL